jgi:hypothetical protein
MVSRVGLLDQPATVWAALSPRGMSLAQLTSVTWSFDHLQRMVCRRKTTACKLSYRATELGWRVSHLTPQTARVEHRLSHRASGRK